MLFIRQKIACLLLLASLSTLSPAQSFVFASPNTREHMTDEAALGSHGSFEQENFVAVARYLARRLCREGEVQGGEGVNGPDTENTALITGCGREPAAYLAGLLGRYAHQKWVLIFSPAAKSPEHLFVLGFTQQPRVTLRLLRQRVVHDATVIAEGSGSQVYIWVKDHSLDETLHALAEETHAQLQDISGKGQLVGNDDRGQAQQTFDKTIAAYERRHNVRFSIQLWSRKLHDLGLRHTVRQEQHAAQ